MAGVDAMRFSSDKIRPYDNVLDHHMESILSRLKDEPMKDVIEDVLVLCSTDELRDAREKLFVLAKEKVSSDLDRGPSDGDLHDKVFGTRIYDPWGMVTRRSKNRLDEDVCRLYLFVIGKDYKFPSKILKRGVFKNTEAQRDIRIALGSVPKGPDKTGLSETASGCTGDAAENPQGAGEPKCQIKSKAATDLILTSECRELQLTNDISDITYDVSERTGGNPQRMNESNSSTPSEKSIDVVPIPEYKEQQPTNVLKDSAPDCSERTLGIACKEDNPRMLTEQAGKVKLPTPEIIVTYEHTRLRDLGVQCCLIPAPPLLPLSVYLSNLATISSTIMANDHDESWDDIIQAEQVNSDPVPTTGADDDGGSSESTDSIEHVLVERAEFDAHVEYVERTLTEYESKFGVLDSWNAQAEHRIDIVDTVLHEKLRLLRIRQQESDCELHNVKRQLNQFMDASKRSDNRSHGQLNQTKGRPQGSGPPVNPPRSGNQADAAQAPSNALPRRSSRGRRRQTKTVTPYAGSIANEMNEKDSQTRPALTPGVVVITPAPTAKNGPSMTRSGTTDTASGDKAMNTPKPASTTSSEKPRPGPQESGSGMFGGMQAAVVNSDPGAHGGARPKTLMKGNTFRYYHSEAEVNDNVAGRTGDESDVRGEQDSETYSKVVTRNGWKGNKRKREVSGQPPAKQVRPIKGFSSKATRELSVQGLSNDGFDTLEDIEDSVNAYCSEHNVDLVFVRVFRRKHEFKTVGCKIAVKDSDAQRVMSRDFWPDDVYARKWHPGNKKQQIDGRADDQPPAQQ